jgi:hypothetical protein
MTAEARFPMTKPVFAFSLAAVTAACLAIAPQDARAGGPCSASCSIADHMAMHHMVAMDDMPGMSGTHATPAPTASAAPQPQTQHPPQGAAAAATLQSMNDMHMEHGGHMQMTTHRPASAADKQRADQIVATLRTAIEPYKDYRAAVAAGYKPFHAELPMPMYHFTNWANAFANVFSFDPARPTSLMYKRVPGGYELVGAMYTASERATDDQLDARVPLSIATWHLHTNLCLPPEGQSAAMWGPRAQFGLAGSITTADACAQAGGTFKAVIYNWMVHVWPFETDPSKVWATEDHPGAMDH